MRSVLALLILLCPAIALADGLLVIANPSVPQNSISADKLAAIYLLQKTSWNDSLPIVAVNRELASDVRERFSASVLKHSPQELVTYWNRMRLKQGRIWLRPQPWWSH